MPVLSSNRVLSMGNGIKKIVEVLDAMTRQLNSFVGDVDEAAQYHF